MCIRDRIALGADKIFTPELKNMIAGVDVKNLSASMAGFVMSDDSGKPNITFSMTCLLYTSRCV